MSTLMEEGIKRWTAKRETALVLKIIQSKTSISEASGPMICPPWTSWVEWEIVERAWRMF